MAGLAFFACISLYRDILIHFIEQNTTLKMKTIEAKELRGKMSDGLLLDVRTPAEHGEIHIPGSHLMPLHQLDEKKAAGLVPAGGACYVICRSGQRARQAAEKLEAAGITEVVVLEGGVNAWDAEGLPVNRGRKTMSIERQTRIAAGFAVVTGLVLGLLVSPWFLALSAFVGCGLIFAGLTDWCGMGLLLARMPWNNRGGSCSADGGASCAR